MSTIFLKSTLATVLPFGLAALFLLVYALISPPRSRQRGFALFFAYAILAGITVVVGIFLHAFGESKALFLAGAIMIICSCAIGAKAIIDDACKARFKLKEKMDKF